MTSSAWKPVSDLTVLVLTYNEEPNISRTLQSVSWAERILVLDSGSSDRTVAIAESFTGAIVLHRAFTTHEEQWNFGLDHVDTGWVLAIDADYVFPDAAREAIRSALQAGPAGFRAEFRYLVYGKTVKGSILPPRTVLFRTDKGRYWQDGHTQRLRLEGKTGQLPFLVSHDDRKPLSRWLHSQITYARLEADKLRSCPNAELGYSDRVRKTIVLAAPMVFTLVYIVRGGFLSGWRGLFYALQRFTAEILLSLFLLDAKLKAAAKAEDDGAGES